MIIHCVADLHGNYPKLDGGDLLIVAGDLTARDTIENHMTFKLWLHNQEYKRKIVIAGNHDNQLVGVKPDKYFYSSYNIITKEQISYADYLCDSGTEFEGLKIWGSPWTLQFEGMNPHCMAFTCATEEELAQKWAMIPRDTDILVCHSPMWGLHDANLEGERCGSKTLLHYHVNNTLNNLKLFVCGHIHEGYGIYDIRHLQEMLGDPIGCVHVNASHVNVSYRPVNNPIRVII